MAASSVAFDLESASPGAPCFDDDERESLRLAPQVPTVERDRWQCAAKRALDLLASLCLIALAAPLMLVIALIIRATSRGPAIFRQRRVGHNGQLFEMLKFRSMVDNAESMRDVLDELNERSGPVFKMRRDPRVTGVGRFIRRFSIDELPQLFNVFRGEMSMVGPRPPIPSEVARYESWQLKRLSVPPGLTCYWQVAHNRGSLAFAEWVQLDLDYIDGWHLGRDLVLILRTVPAVLTGRGQY